MTPGKTQDRGEPSRSHVAEAQVGIYEWPITLRFLFFLMSAGMPVLFFLVLTGDAERALAPWFLSLWLGTVTTASTSLIFSFGIRRAVPLHLLYLSSLAVTLLVAFYARWGLGQPWFIPLLLMFLTAVTLFRFGRIASPAFSSADHRRAFLSDTAVIAGVGVYSLLMAPASGINDTVSGVTSLTACCTAFLRLYFLWVLERQASGTKPSARSSWLPILILTVLAAIFGPTILFHTLTGMFGAAGLLFVPVVMLFSHLHLHANFFARLVAASQLGARKQATHPIPPAPTPGWLHFVPIITLVMVLIVLLYLLFRPRRDADPTLEETENDIETVERRPVRHNRQMAFVHTMHPVRLRIQQWLGERKKAGNEMLPHETVRQFAQRSDSVPDPTLVEMYEEVRYDTSDEKEE